MKCTLRTEGYYFNTKRWFLDVTLGRKNPVIKTFFLGQDCKFISRVLGMDWGYFMKSAGVRKITTDKEKTKVGNYIKKELGLNPDIVRKLQSWELSAE